ncbi:MAG TPA: RHS repeat-associated core domain-containing protein, partial [Acidimicrobiales bacterium]|nr:RHS repeat-associated core domain-containing protein [Acidimicrobiales bacterium]
TNVDGTGTPIRRYLDPYGNPLAATSGGSWPDIHAFLDKPSDATTALDDVGARQYDPSTGRFIQPDPQLNTADPASTNGYGYSDANPVTKSDPSGLTYMGPGGWNCEGSPSQCAAAASNNPVANGGVDPMTEVINRYTLPS